MMSGGGALFQGMGWFDAVDLQPGPGGTFYAVGTVWSGAPVNGAYRATWGMERFKADGSRDLSFGPDGSGTATFSGNDNVNGWQVKAFADGSFLMLGGSGEELVVQRFRADGSPDPQYHGGTPLELRGGVAENLVPPADLEGDGSVRLVWAEDGAIDQERITADGSVDETFGPDGVRRTPLLMSSGDGSAYAAPYVVAARWDAAGGMVAYVDDDSTTAIGPATLFRVEVGPAGELIGERPVPLGGDLADTEHVVSLAPDGSAYVAAVVVSSSPDVEKLDPLGNLDPSFGVGGVARMEEPGAWVYGVRPNGQLVVQWGSEHTVVLNADGSRDPDFNRGDPIAYMGTPMVAADGSVWIVYSSGADLEEIDGLPTRVTPDGSDGQGGADNTLVGGDPAVFALARRGAQDFAGEGADGLFDPTTGATLFNPDGTALLN